MFDWYLLLFIAFTLVILCIDKIGSHRSIYEFTNRKEVGLSGGTYSLVIPYMTGATFLFPFLFTVKSGISSFFIFLISPLFLYIILRSMISSQERIDEMLPDQMNYTERKNIIPFFLFGISSLGSILIQTTLMVMLFQDFFKQPASLGIFLFLIFSFVLFGLGGRSGVNRVGNLLLIGILFTISFTVLILYLRTGTGIVYQQITRNFDGLYHGSIIENILCFLTFIFVMAGQTFTSVYFWESVSVIRPNHRISALRYSSFSWTALLLSFTGLSIYLLSNADTLTATELMKSVIRSNNILSHIFVYTGIAMLAVGTGHSLYSLLSLFLHLRTASHNQQSSYHTLKQAYLFGIVLVVVIGFTCINLSEFFTEWLPYFISFFTSAAVPFFYALVKNNFSRSHFAMTVGMMSIAGVPLSILISEIWLVAPITATLTICVHIVGNKFK
ncbi:hypothetical protein [Mesobacillus jeotgali]|uniref:hypothetical protein n=1 Tax=Mesobacillus jeotgali TaxID=129985 RepID=UPI0009A71CA0|nr:hypothetical protein [Mesobacillus jeotgali]